MYLDHLCHVALGARVVSLVLHPHQHNEVQVVPHVVFVFDVLLKGHGLVVKLVPFQPWERQGRVEEEVSEQQTRGRKLSASPPKGDIQVLLIVRWHLAHGHPNQGTATQQETSG